MPCVHARRYRQLHNHGTFSVAQGPSILQNTVLALIHWKHRYNNYEFVKVR